MDETTRKALMSSQDMDWVTPQWLFDKLMPFQSRLSVDMAATALTKRCGSYYGPDHPDPTRQDSLICDWPTGVVCWLNPPYGRAIKHWMAKCAEQAARGARIKALIPARTDTQWWHESVHGAASQVELLAGRVSFERPDGTVLDPAPFPSAVVSYGFQVDFFKEVIAAPLYTTLNIPRPRSTD